MAVSVRQQCSAASPADRWRAWGKIAGGSAVSAFAGLGGAVGGAIGIRLSHASFLISPGWSELRGGHWLSLTDQRIRCVRACLTSAMGMRPCDTLSSVRRRQPRWYCCLHVFEQNLCGEPPFVRASKGLSHQGYVAVVIIFYCLCPSRSAPPSLPPSLPKGVRWRTSSWKAAVNLVIGRRVRGRRQPLGRLARSY